MRFSSVLLAGSALVAHSTVAEAQQPTRPPIRAIGQTVAASTESFGTIGTIRSLPGGRLLVNDITGRRVVMLDSMLAPVAVVADTTSATGNAYSARFAGLLAYRGDSSLFIDPQSLSMLVIDAEGKIARVMSVPRSQDAFALTGGPFGGSAFDGTSGIVYRGGNNIQMRRSGGPGDAVGSPPPQPDSTAVVRIDLATRALDTLTFVRIPKVDVQMTQDDNGRMSISRRVNPLPTVDDWAMMPDGTLAIVRGRDYHVDWIHADGTRSASARIPFDWRRMTDDDKVAFIDSVQAARQRLVAADSAAAADGAARPGGNAASAATGGPATAIMSVRVGGPEGEVRTTSGATQVQFVRPEELPDYRPPFFANAVRADMDGNLWIRTTAAPTEQGASVHDVVNSKGELIDRVQIGGGRTIAGFGRDGSVYLVSREGTRTTLERARLR